MTTEETAPPVSPRGVPGLSGPPAEARLTLAEALRTRAGKQPDDLAFVALDGGEEPGDTLTYRELDAEADRRAAALCAGGLDSAPAVLLYPAGLEFVRVLLGCMRARVIAAPVQVPSRERGLERMRRIADDAGASTVLTVAEVRDDLRSRFADSPLLAGLNLVATDELPRLAPPSGPEPFGPGPGPEDVALLQYTSGSTGAPKGVVVTHANFVSNVLETEEQWPSKEDGVFVSWLPHFHDMGMLFGVVMPLWVGRPSYLMAPEAFIRRPFRWLEALARFGGTHSAAPSFAYQQCVSDAERRGVPDDLDLSAWRVAVNGAEPVRWSVVDAFTRTFASAGFAPEAMCPGYGLAENTLKATGSPQNRRPAVLWAEPEALREGRVVPADGAADQSALPLVGSGVTAGSTRVRIVDPETGGACPPGRVGEIWIGGPCVAGGYWRRQHETRETFGARVVGEEGDGRFLRTGDLGFRHEGELFVAGRLKDLIIRKGRNFYPQDIELSVERTDSGLRPNCSAAFSVDDGEEERLVLVVEVDGRVLGSTGPEALAARIRAAVHDTQRLSVHDVVLVRRGSLPKTSSGKVQRRTCRTRYEEGTLSLAAVAGTPTAPGPARATGTPA